MPTCVGCDNYFRTKLRINGKVRNLGGRSYCLDCSPFGSVNRRRQKQKPRDKPVSRLFCTSCGRKLKDVRRKKCPTCYMNEYRKKKLEILRSVIGCKCTLCNYGDEKRRSLLLMHHVDPSIKSFCVNLRGMTYGWEKIWLEVDKCMMVCIRCHKEIHLDLVSLSKINKAWKGFVRRVHKKRKSGPNGKGPDC